jgi:hypothetical protein
LFAGRKAAGALTILILQPAWLCGYEICTVTPLAFIYTFVLNEQFKKEEMSGDSNIQMTNA